MDAALAKNPTEIMPLPIGIFRNDRLPTLGAGQAAAGDPTPVKDELVAEKGSRYIDFLLPGLLGMNLMGTGMWGMGFTIANARMKKLLKRLVATPMRKSASVSS